jgi:hypothetical protein
MYTAPGGDYNLHRITQICQIVTEIRYVDYLYLYMNNSKIIRHEWVQCLCRLIRVKCRVYGTQKGL